MSREHAGHMSEAAQRQTLQMYEEIAEGRPGDVAIEGWFVREHNTTALCDIVVGHPLAASYVKRASKQKAFLCGLLERRKKAKYRDLDALVPCAVEAFGGCGRMMQQVLKRLASSQAANRNAAMFPILLNRMRSRIAATVVFEAVDMILSSVTV